MAEIPKAAGEVPEADSMVPPAVPEAVEGAADDAAEVDTTALVVVDDGCAAGHPSPASEANEDLESPHRLHLDGTFF